MASQEDLEAGRLVDAEDVLRETARGRFVAIASREALSISRRLPMPENISAETKTHSIEQLHQVKAEVPEKGLASLPGGWEGSDELADRLAKIRRTAPRVIPELEACELECAGQEG